MHVSTLGLSIFSSSARIYIYDCAWNWDLYRLFAPLPAAMTGGKKCFRFFYVYLVFGWAFDAHWFPREELRESYTL